MGIPSTRGYDADLALVGTVAEVPPYIILGWALITWLPGGEVRLAHNACCSAHAREKLVWALNNALPVQTDCPGEH